MRPGDVAGIVSAAAAIVTLIIVIIQLGIMRRQTKLMRGQAKLMEDQLKLMNRQDAFIQRRSDLVMETKQSILADDAVMVEVLVLNRGNKAASDFYWHVFFPAHLVANLARREGGGDGVGDFTSDEVLIGEQLHRHFTGVRREPLYATRRTVLGRFQILLADAQTGFDIWWQIAAEDGPFPDTGGTAKLSVRL